jgi:hypothetical protein
MQLHKSNNHRRFYEKKCPVPLWQNKVLVQHCSPWRCQLLVSAPTLVWGHLWGCNATTQVQQPSKILWEEVPSSAMAEQGPGATLQSLEVPITSVGPDTSMRAPLGLQCNHTSPTTIEDFMRRSAQFRYGRKGSWCNIAVPGGANY